MRKLINGTNVDAADADYLKGRVRNKVGATPGTVWDELINGDIIEFFQKLVVDGPITENDLPDNVSNGHQLVQALVAKIDSLNGGVRTKVIDIGDWDMDASQGITVAHGLVFTKIRSVTAMIRNDANSSYSPIDAYDVGVVTGGVGSTDATNVTLARANGSFYDSVNYDSTSFNRGWITIEYVV